MAATANIDINTSANYTKATTLATYSGTPKVFESLALDTAAITKVYSAAGTFATTTTVDVSSLTDVYGASIAFTTVKGVVIKNTHATATLTIGGGTFPLFGTDQYTLKPGHCIPITSSFAVSTNINLRFVPSASCTYELLVVGS